VGFDRLMYAVDTLDGEIDPPDDVFGYGFDDDYVDIYLKRMHQDPLRRMVARGEIVVANTPIWFENNGAGLSIAPERRLSSGDLSMLRWTLSQGVRTGVSFRVRLEPGRTASLNFYSRHSCTQREIDTAQSVLFLLGHQVHARLEPHLSRRRQALLSEREAECLVWIAQGKSNGEIALVLGLSLDTVKEHVHSLFRKLQVNSRAQAVSRGHTLAYLS
jgi:DNA-binding CsgD family transcriptional regulator